MGCRGMGCRGMGCRIAPQRDASSGGGVSLVFLGRRAVLTSRFSRSGGEFSQYVYRWVRSLARVRRSGAARTHVDALEQHRPALVVEEPRALRRQAKGLAAAARAPRRRRGQRRHRRRWKLRRWRGWRGRLRRRRGRVVTTKGAGLALAPSAVVALLRFGAPALASPRREVVGVRGCATRSQIDLRAAAVEPRRKKHEDQAGWDGRVVHGRYMRRRASVQYPNQCTGWQL